MSAALIVFGLEVRGLAAWASGRLITFGNQNGAIQFRLCARSWGNATVVGGGLCLELKRVAKSP